MKNKKYRFYLNVLISTLSIILFILTAEIICIIKEHKESSKFDDLYRKNFIRIFDPSNPTGYQPSEIPGLGWEITSNLGNGKPKGALSTVTGKVSRSNSIGMRDKEYDKKKKEGIFRIIVLGDSVTEGFELEEEERYTEILEEKLNQDTSKSFEVWNAAIGGTNTFQQLLLFENKFLAYEPDLVIIERTWNDYDPTPLILSNTKNAQTYKTPNIIPLPRVLDFFLIQHSSFYRFLSDKTYNVLNKLNPKKYPNIIYKGNYGQEAVQQNREAIKQFATLSKKNGFELVLMLIPYLKEEIKTDEWLKTVPPKDYNTTVIDLEPYLREEEQDLSRFKILPDDVIHLNKNAHQIIADVLYNYITKVNQTIS